MAVVVLAGLKRTARLCTCAGGRLHLSTYYSQRCLCQQQHVHLSMAALRFTIYRNLFNQWYMPWYLLSDKDILLIQILVCAFRLQCAPWKSAQCCWAGCKNLYSVPILAWASCHLTAGKLGIAWSCRLESLGPTQRQGSCLFSLVPCLKLREKTNTGIAYITNILDMSKHCPKMFACCNTVNSVVGRSNTTIILRNRLSLFHSISPEYP